jgi:hypothetical protein
MRETTLPSPGNLTWGHQLRRMCAIAISAIEISGRHSVSGKSRQAKQLSTFFTACATAIASYVDAVAPTVSSRVRTATNTVVITCSETLSPSTSVPVTAFVFSPARTVTAVVVSGTTITITATGAVAGDTVAYTQPALASQQVVDGAGNPLATFGATAVA